MLEGLKDNGTYFGYVQNNDNQDMLYAELYAPYDLVVLTSTPMKDFYLQTMSEFKAFEQNFETQIHVAIGIACASFIIAILGGIATFKYMKSKEVENEREQIYFQNSEPKWNGGKLNWEYFFVMQNIEIRIYHYNQLSKHRDKAKRSLGEVERFFYLKSL